MERINIFVEAPADFKIRSKQDAERFLSELVKEGAKLEIQDVEDPECVDIINRSMVPHEPAYIAHEQKNWRRMVMYRGEQAVELAYRAKESINAHFFA